MAAIDEREWLDEDAKSRIQRLLSEFCRLEPRQAATRVYELCREHDLKMDHSCISLNAGTNAMDPMAQELLASGLGTRPSLGYPGSKYEMGLQESEAIEVLCLDLIKRLFHCRYAELRVLSGAMANLYAYMALARPGDTMMSLPERAGGHATHKDYGAAGLYGLRVIDIPYDDGRMNVDLDRLRESVKVNNPTILLVGASLALFPYPLKEIRAIADEVGAHVIYDAAHLSGLLAGGQFQKPLQEGAHIVTMSTYKSLGGPSGGLLLMNDEGLAKRLEAIAYPGLTANFDMARVAALAVTAAGWLSFGREYATAMQKNAIALAEALATQGFAVVGASPSTRSHQLAIAAAPFGGGTRASRRLEPSHIFTTGIGLPGPAVDGDYNGVRLATQEVTRWGMTEQEMPSIAKLIARVLLGGEDAAALRPEVMSLRQRFQRLHYVL